MTARTKAQRRELSLALLTSIKSTLERSAPELRLGDDERAYLIEACDRALAGEPDPLLLGKPAGRQVRGNLAIDEARHVHRLLKAGATLKAACDAASVALRSHRDTGGAVRKNYQAHRKALEAADRIYARRPRDDDFSVVLKVRSRGN